MSNNEQEQQIKIYRMGDSIIAFNTKTAQRMTINDETLLDKTNDEIIKVLNSRNLISKNERS